MADSYDKIPDPVFFNAELLNILCFSPANLIIRGYAHPDRLAPLIKALQQYEHCILEMGRIESNEYFREFLEDCSDHFLSFGRKRLVVMSDIKEIHIDTVLKAENVKWVMIIPDPAIKLPRNLRNVYIYTPRTGRILPELPAKPIFEELAVKTAIRSAGRYIDTLARIIGHMFDFSAKIYRAFISSGEKGVRKVMASAFSSLPPEQKEIILPKVRKMINAYFGIDIPCITNFTITFFRNGDGIISDAVSETPEISVMTGNINADYGVKTENGPSFESVSADRISSGIREISADELKVTIKEIAEHPHVADIIKSGKNTNNNVHSISSDAVFEKEFRIISKYPSIKKTFMGVLIKYGREITKPNDSEEFPDAEYTYRILRKNKWKNGIPGNVIKEWISLHFSGLKLKKYSPNPVLERERFIEILEKLGFDGDFINGVFPEKEPGTVHTLIGKDENIPKREKIASIGMGKDYIGDVPPVNIGTIPSRISCPETDPPDNISDRFDYKTKKEKSLPTETDRLIENGTIKDLRKFNMIMVEEFRTVIKRLKNISIFSGNNRTEIRRYGNL